MLNLQASTPDMWIGAVFADFPAFLRDHAACEKKASGMALSLIAHYPDRPPLVDAMMELAREELEHYISVHELMKSRGIELGRDAKDPYVNALRGTCLRAGDDYFLDQLILGAVIEARGCERFKIVADSHPDEAIRDFYTELVRSESRHHGMFLRLAREFFPTEKVNARAAKMFEIEARVMLAQPIRATLH